jgi:hypothetical protein
MRDVHLTDRALGPRLRHLEGGLRRRSCRPPAGGRAPRYRIFRPIDDPNHVVVDLEFDGSGEAKGFRAALRDLWRRIEVEDAQARIVEEVESGEY